MRALLLLVLLAAGSCLAQNIAYTVQVIAVSDQSQAFSLIRELGVENYPAYATRATTEQGDVVRVRIGGFANRAAAVLYAEAMPDFPTPGSRPLPALADNIPAGVMPFEPRLLLDTSETDFELLEWGGGLALAYPAEASGLRNWQLLADGASVEFKAYSAWREPDGLVVRYRDQPLWPDDWQELTGAQLEEERTMALELLASRLAVEPAALQGAVRDRAGQPVVVVLERFNPWQSVSVGQLLGATLTDGDSDWDGSVVGESPEPVPAEVLLADPASLQPVPVSGDDWSLRFDDPFMLQTTPDLNRSWRAAVGAPLWTDGTHVLASHQGRLLIYDFRANP